MILLAAIVFVALYFVKAGYGMLRDGRWGPKIDNRLGWILMEAPVFVAMALLWWFSDRRTDTVRLIFFGLFQLHYLNRAFIYPLLIRTPSPMPIGIITMGVVFNVLNACMQGGWIFYFSRPTAIRSSGSLRHSSSSVHFFSSRGWPSISTPTTSSGICANRETTNHYLPRGGFFPLCYFGQLFRRDRRVDRIRHPYLVAVGGSLRNMDLCQSGTPSQHHLGIVTGRCSAMKSAGRNSNESYLLYINPLFH